MLESLFGCVLMRTRSTMTQTYRHTHTLTLISTVSGFAIIAICGLLTHCSKRTLETEHVRADLCVQ